MTNFYIPNFFVSIENDLIRYKEFILYFLCTISAENIDKAKDTKLHRSKFLETGSCPLQECRKWRKTWTA